MIDQRAFAGRVPLRATFVAIAGLVLAGCATKRDAREYYNYYDDGQPGAKHIASLADHVRGMAAEGRAFNAHTSDETAEARQKQAAEFLDAGMTLTDLLCLDGFSREMRRKQHTSFGRSLLNDTNGLVSAIMGLTNAGSVATGVVGAGFSYAGSTVEGFEENYMVSIDLPSAQALVQRAMSAQAASFADPQHAPENYYQAERALIRYATTCTFSGIRALLAQSVRTSEPIADEQGIVTMAAPAENVTVGQEAGGEDTD
jgi:hypothetical protein